MVEQYMALAIRSSIRGNLCLDRPPLRHEGTDRLIREHIEKMYEEDIWVRPER